MMNDVNDEYVVDHINGIRSDNRLCNLRYASVSENAHNKHRVCIAPNGKMVGRYYEVDRKYKNLRKMISTLAELKRMK